MNRLIERHYPEYRFGGFTDIDGTTAFFTRLRALVKPTDVVLDIGCGRGVGLEDPVRIRRELRSLRGHCKRVIGIDVDPSGEKNESLDEFGLIRDSTWPVESGTIDLAFADFVLEHVAEPQHFFGECQRVVKPDGYLCIRTPNVLSYFGLVAKVVPRTRHRDILSFVQPSRCLEDTFPVFYRANTRRKLLALLRHYGFDGCVYGYEAEPSYIPPGYKILYRLAVWHARCAPTALKVCLFLFSRRIADEARGDSMRGSGRH